MGEYYEEKNVSIFASNKIVSIGTTSDGRLLNVSYRCASFHVVVERCVHDGGRGL